MKVIINYEGHHLLVDEELKACLDELRHEEALRARRNRRHEVLWDGLLLETMEVIHQSMWIHDAIENEVIERI